jgi:lipopolysaccharide/colanic/teichoic acid biosynthesis glycosyltransferase
MRFINKFLTLGEMGGVNMLNKEGIDSEAQNKFMYNIVKRLIDILGSIAGIIILSPFLLVIAILVRVDSKGPVLFSHKRLGLGGKIIKVYKFRTMVSDAEELLKRLTPEQKEEYEKNFKLENDPRITKLGRFLRESSIDELPQLLNVLKGEMSAVGPRPIVPTELQKYGEYADKLLSVKPGLTGSWQTSGRSDTTYEERVQLDMEYIDTRTILVDVKIAFKTVGVVFKKSGAR